MRVLAIANQKGGCGKTTTSINLAACLADLGKKVLLFDLDPQGHSTCGLGAEVCKPHRTVYDLLTRQSSEPLDVADISFKINDNLDLAPSYEILAALEEELAGAPGNHERLKVRVKHPLIRANKYDFVILDCPPNLGILTFNAFEAADEIIIPVEPSFFSLHGLAKISETLKTLNEGRYEPIKVHALLTLFNPASSFCHEVYEEVQKHFGDALFKTIIHENQLFKEAAAAGKSIVQYASGSKALLDYRNLSVEYLERNWQRVLSSRELGWEGLLRSRYAPKRVCGGVLFQIFTDQGREVEIAGDFNQWVPEPLIARKPEGLWQKVLPLGRGKFRYKYIVDGEWQVDPNQANQKANVYGGYDSVLEIAS